MIPYNDAYKIAETTEFVRNGGDKERAAAYLGCKPEDLPKLLDLPKPKPVRGDVETGVDLWAVDRAKEVL
jgi:hypothetical protein